MIPNANCSAYSLRLVSLVCSIVNVFLIYEIKSLTLHIDYQNKIHALLETLTLSTLPPMYFFAHLYYTDVPSITMVLFMILFSFHKRHFLSAIFGVGSVLMRQTNVVWVAGVLGVHLVDLMMLKLYPKMRRENATFANFWNALKAHLRHERLLLNFIVGSIREFYAYMLVIIAFVVFVIMNGSIVGELIERSTGFAIVTSLFLISVGDKTAHEASLHLPQLFYFSIFVLVFGSSMWIPQLLKVHRIFRSWKCLLGIVILAGLIALVVQYNTLIHPYMLADNRHYTFYIWNRFYARYELARFAIIPVYIFGLSVICSSIDGSIGFKIFFIVSTILTLCLQSMIEVRYFLIPFLLLRLNRTKVTKKWSFVELLINLALNYITFNIFFTREIRWSNFEDAQRIIW